MVTACPNTKADGEVHFQKPQDLRKTLGPLGLDSQWVALKECTSPSASRLPPILASVGMDLQRENHVVSIFRGFEFICPVFAFVLICPGSLANGLWVISLIAKQ